MPYECVAFLNWIRFCNGNANNKAIFVVVIGVSHHIHMIGHCNSKRKERKKWTKDKSDKKNVLWTVNWGRLSLVRLWLWPLNDRFGLTEWYFFCRHFIASMLSCCLHFSNFHCGAHVRIRLLLSIQWDILTGWQLPYLSTEHYVGFSGIEHFRWSFG